MHFYSPAIREICFKVGLIFIASCLKVNGEFISTIHKRISARYLIILKGRCENHFTRAQCHMIPSIAHARWLILWCRVKERWSLVMSPCRLLLTLRSQEFVWRIGQQIYFYMYMKNMIFGTQVCMTRRYKGHQPANRWLRMARNRIENNVVTKHVLSRQTGNNYHTRLYCVRGLAGANTMDELKYFD